MIKTEPLLNINFNLPNHDTELNDAKCLLIKIMKNLNTIYSEKSINKYYHEYYYEEIIRILDYVGKLSIPASALSESIETMYCKKFPNSPALAKKMWLDHYKSIHKKYNKLKNTCFNLLDELDAQYINTIGANPPNWKP